MLHKSIGGTWREQYKQLLETGDLNEFFEKSFFTNRQIVQGLISRELEADERVKDFFQKGKL